MRRGGGGGRREEGAVISFRSIDPFSHSFSLRLILGLQHPVLSKSKGTPDVARRLRRNSYESELKKERQPFQKKTFAAALKRLRFFFFTQVHNRMV